MRRIFKWLGIVLLGIGGLAIIATGYVWVASERLIDATYPVPSSSFAVDSATADIEAGKRQAIILGCYGGCHGEGLDGQVFNDDLAFGVIHAPNLTQAFARMSDEELDVSIRHGLRRDGTSHLVMPSSSFQTLSDRDFNNIVAFIRSQPVTEGPGFEMRPGIVARFFLLNGMFRTQVDRIRNDPSFISESEYLENGEPSGKYLAVTVCGECHGTNLAGTPSFTPHLAIATAYSEDAFGRLMREGVGLGNRDLGLMTQVAKSRFKHLSDTEVSRLWRYLQTLAVAEGEAR